MKSLLKTLLLITCMTLAGISTNAQDAKKTLSIDDYNKWSRITSVSLSEDGNWMSYGYSPNGGDDTLYIRDIKSGKIFSDKYCNDPEFSYDSMWVVYKKNLKKKGSR